MTDDDQDDDTPRERPVIHGDDLLQRVHALEANNEEQRLDIASLLATRRSWRWTLGLGLPVLLTTVVVVMLWAIDRVSVSSERTGRTEGKIETIEMLNKARTDALENLIRLLQQDVSQLRQRAGLDTKPTSDRWSLPDKLSLSPHKDPHVLVSHP